MSPLPLSAPPRVEPEEIEVTEGATRHVDVRFRTERSVLLEVEDPLTGRPWVGQLNLTWRRDRLPDGRRRIVSGVLMRAPYHLPCVADGTYPIEIQTPDGRTAAGDIVVAGARTRTRLVLK